MSHIDRKWTEGIDGEREIIGGITMNGAQGGSNKTPNDRSRGREVMKEPG